MTARDDRGQGQRGTVTVTEQVCYQHPLHDPAHATSRYSQAVYNDEQPYHRTVQVGADWQMLDAGWLVGTPVLLSVHNKGPASAALWFGDAPEGLDVCDPPHTTLHHNQSLRMPNPGRPVWARLALTELLSSGPQNGCTLTYLFLPGEGKERQGFTVAPSRHHVAENGPPTGPLGNVVSRPVDNGTEK